MRGCVVFLLVAIALPMRARSCYGITFNSAATAFQMADDIVDQSTGLVLAVAPAPDFGIKASIGAFVPSDPVSNGTFANGITAPGTPLPTNNPGGSYSYAGGIGIASGICLCTGYLTDADDGIAPAMNTLDDLQNGLEGPNNGIAGGMANPGEIRKLLSAGIDTDFTAITGFPVMGDASALQFSVTISKPSHIRVSFIFGSDEVDAWLDATFNDSFIITIDGKNIADITAFGLTSPFDLQEIEECGPLFVHAGVAPSPMALTQSAHAQPGKPLYDIELGGFTKKLTRETKKVLAPGTYKVRIVVHDVVDQAVDSALFIPTDGLKARCFLPADFNLDGIIDGADAGILISNWGKTGACFEEADANGNGIVDAGDYGILVSNWGAAGGHRNFSADFDYDGDVDANDGAILNSFGSLLKCASRAEGDTNKDGDVGTEDEDAYDAQFPSSSGSATNCGGSSGAFAGGGSPSGFQAPSSDVYDPGTLEKIDVDQDGDFDLDDLKVWEGILGVGDTKGD